MVTFAQAQERADEWVNGDVPAYQHREVRVREFELGFVVWAEDRAEGPVSDGGRQRLVIARDSGEATLWPGLPVGEVIRRYEEDYGAPAEVGSAPEPPQRIDLNQTSFLLTPPEWLQEAADKLGIPDRRAEADADASPADAVPSSPSSPSSAPVPGVSSPSVPAPAGADSGAGWPAAGGQVDHEPTANDGVPAGATPWAGTDTNAAGDVGGVPLPATVFAPPLSGSDDDGTPPPVVPAEAPTALMSGGSQLPRTAVVPGLDPQAPPPGTAAPAPGAPVPPGRVAPGAGDIADAATSKAVVPPRGARGSAPTTPPPPGAPGTPGVRPGTAPPPSGPGAPGAPAGATCRRRWSPSWVLRGLRLPGRRRLRVRRSRLLLQGLPVLPARRRVRRRLRVAGCITPRRCSPTRASVDRTRRVPRVLLVRPVRRVRCRRLRPVPRRRVLPVPPGLRVAGCTMPRRCWRVRARPVRVRRSRPALRVRPVLPGCRVRPPRRLRGRTDIRSSRRGSRRSVRAIRPCCASVRPTAVSSS